MCNHVLRLLCIVIEMGWTMLLCIIPGKMHTIWEIFYTGNINFETLTLVHEYFIMSKYDVVNTDLGRIGSSGLLR